MALCSGLASLINNHFGRRALLRGRLRLHAINATALIEETVTVGAPNRGRGRFMVASAGRSEDAGADELTATRSYEFCKGRRAPGRTSQTYSRANPFEERQCA